MESERNTFEEQLSAVVASVSATRDADEDAARRRLDRLTKPVGSLGRLEDIAAAVARMQRSDRPSVEKKAVLLMAGDHGVVEEGVAPYPQEVTRQMIANFSAGGAAINQIAASVGSEVRVYDVGVAGELPPLEGVYDRRVAAGTRNMARETAMTREECAQAVLVGVEAAREAAEQGIKLLGTGEMGIGNSTAAAAVTAAFTGIEPGRVVGVGTGLDAKGVEHKADIVRQALRVNGAADLDPLGKLAAVGGLEIAALAGVIIGGAEEGVCVVSDGFISGSATLAAVSMCPASRDYIMPSHLSTEPGHKVVLDALGLKPVFELDMRLGEGTGAALAMGVIDAACRVLSGMATFDEAGVAEAAE